jgi:hypothetical protein
MSHKIKEITIFSVLDKNYISVGLSEKHLKEAGETIRDNFVYGFKNGKRSKDYIKKNAITHCVVVEKNYETHIIPIDIDDIEKNLLKYIDNLWKK